MVIIKKYTNRESVSSNTKCTRNKNYSERVSLPTVRFFAELSKSFAHAY